MALFRKGAIWRYDFRFGKKRYQGSTHTKNHEAAKSIVAKLRTDLALGLAGLSVRKPAPLFKDFIEGAFLKDVRQNAQKPRTVAFYEEKSKRLVEYPGFQKKRVDEVDELVIQGFKDWCGRQKKRSRGPGLISIAEINGRLRTLRKALIFAKRAKIVLDRPHVSTLPGEQGRTFTLTGELETAYLAAATFPLREIAILMLDLGLRTEEAVSLRRSDVTDESVTIREGKTPNARRSLPQTDRTREVFKTIAAFDPDAEWVFPGRKGHLTRGTIDNLHTALRDARDWPREFVLYSCRHTYGTRLAESGASPFVIKSAMGHSSIRVSERYIHPRSDDISLALKRKEALDKLIRGENVLPSEVTTAEKGVGGNPRQT